MQRELLGTCGVLLFGLFSGLSGALAGPTPQELAANQTYQCTVNWNAESDICKNRKDAAGGKCTEKYQGEHSSANEAKERCEHAYGVHLNSGAESCDPCWVVKSTQGDCLEHCKDLCYQLWEKCRDNCP
jgi:hypothetical protein